MSGLEHVRSYVTQPGERGVVGGNLGLPGNYALYLVASGVSGIFLWMLIALSVGDSGYVQSWAVVISLLPASFTAVVVFGFLLGKPPHFAQDWWIGLGRDSFAVSKPNAERVNPLIEIIY